MNQSPDKIIEPCDFSITADGVYIIDKRLGLASVRVALLPSEMARLVEFYNSQPLDQVNR